MFHTGAVLPFIIKLAVRDFKVLDKFPNLTKTPINDRKDTHHGWPSLVDIRWRKMIEVFLEISQPTKKWISRFTTIRVIPSSTKEYRFQRILILDVNEFFFNVSCSFLTLYSFLFTKSCKKFLNFIE